MHIANGSRKAWTAPLFLVAKVCGLFGVQVSCQETVGCKLVVVKELSFLIIRLETLWENCSTCFLMYRRKASLDQQPIIIMEKVGTCANYMCMTAPERMGCVPILVGANTRTSFPTIPAAYPILVHAVVVYMVLR